MATVSKKKYSDSARYPKVQTKGYEQEFKNNYESTLQVMIKTLGTKMIKIVNN
jgi:hypothetical protein